MGHIKEGLSCSGYGGLSTRKLKNRSATAVVLKPPRCALGPRGELLEIHCSSVPTLKDADSISLVCSLGIWNLSESSPGEPSWYGKALS